MKCSLFRAIIQKDGLFYKGLETIYIFLSSQTRKMDCLQKKIHDICFWLFQQMDSIRTSNILSINIGYIQVIYIPIYIYIGYIYIYIYIYVCMYVCYTYDTFLNNTRGTNPEMWIRLSPLFGCNGCQCKKLDLFKELLFFTFRFLNNSRF